MLEAWMQYETNKGAAAAAKARADRKARKGSKMGTLVFGVGFLFSYFRFQSFNVFLFR